MHAMARLDTFEVRHVELCRRTCDQSMTNCTIDEVRRVSGARRRSHWTGRAVRRRLALELAIAGETYEPGIVRPS